MIKKIFDQDCPEAPRRESHRFGYDIAATCSTPRRARVLALSLASLLSACPTASLAGWAVVQLASSAAGLVFLPKKRRVAC